MEDISIDREAETLLREFASDLTEPRIDECLYCYVARMLDEFGCDSTLRWARRYRDLRAPRATALGERLGSMGGYCDCEVFMNGMRLSETLCTRDEYGELELPDGPLPCGGVRRGSTRSCGTWVHRRGWWD